MAVEQMRQMTITKTGRFLGFQRESDEKVPLYWSLKTRRYYTEMDDSEAKQSLSVRPSVIYNFFKNYRLNDLTGDEVMIKKIKLLKGLNRYKQTVRSLLECFASIEPYEILMSLGIEIDPYSYYFDDYQRDIQRNSNTDGMLYVKALEAKNLGQVRTILNEVTLLCSFCPSFRGQILNKEFGTSDDDLEWVFSFSKKVIRKIERLYPYSQNLRLDLQKLKERDGNSKDLEFLWVLNPNSTKAQHKYVTRYLKPFEGFRVHDAVDLLLDYYRICEDIGTTYDRYPKYLKSIHDIMMVNYEAKRQQYDADKFYQRAQQFKQLEGVAHDFCVVVPEKPADLIEEGAKLHHCVSSYVPRILNGECMILFLRKKASAQESLVTVELHKNTIVQARGSCNRSVSEEERTALQLFAEKNELNIEI